MLARVTRRSLAGFAAAVAMAPLALLATATGPASADPPEMADSGGITVRNGAGMSLASVRSDGASGDARAKPGGSSNGINYNGGPVILGATNVYYIWYGNWSGNSGQTILTDFASNVGGSPYFNINTTYTSTSGRVSNSVHFAGSTTDDYSLGRNLSDAGVATVVSSAITSGRLPKDTNGVYFVLTASDVAESSGFLTKYCGWHTHGTMSGSDIKYSFVGNPNGNGACLQQTGASPNGDINADGMASVIAHELEEAATDPDLNAWYDRRGYENADKCAWTFGTTYTAGGALANVKLGGRDYLIQRNWVNASGGYCAMSY
jgi:hypothetical protein